MKALLMAGGQGSRLRPLTCDRPKPMVPILNQPVMAHILRHLAAAGLQDVIVTLHLMPEVVQRHFGTGDAWGVRLHYLVEEEPLGTAGSAARARPVVDGTLVVVSGDALTDIDLGAAVRFHRERGAVATLVLKPVPDPTEYGMVVTGSDGRIRRFLEKPGRGEIFSDHVNTGIYVLEPEVLERVPAGRAVDFSKEIFPGLLEDGAPLYGWVAPEGYWSDIGTPEQYRQAHLDMLARLGGLFLGPGEWAAAGCWVGQGCRIAPAARLLAPCVVGPGCDIEPGAQIGPFASLGRGCHVGRGASVRHSVLWDGCRLGPEAEVRGAILADGVTLGRGARVFEGAVLGLRCQVGAGAVVGPGVRLWPDKRVDELEEVARHVVWSGTAARSAVGPSGVRGMANTELTPEMACGVAGAFAGRLRPGSRVAVAHGGTPAARALAWAAAAGVSSSGCHVQWLDAAASGEARAAIVQGSDAGIYVAVAGEPGGAGEEATEARLRLWDGRGVDLDPQAARAVDGAFRRDEWRRVGPAGAGEIRSAFELRAHARQAYLDGLKERHARLLAAGSRLAAALLASDGAGPDAVPGGFPGEQGPQARGLFPGGPSRVVVVSGGGTGESPGVRLLVDALEACGVEAIMAAGPPGGEGCGHSGSGPGPLFWVAVDPAGERLRLWEPSGRPVAEPAREDLACLLAITEVAGRTPALAAAAPAAVAVPVWAGGAVEAAAHRLGVAARRTAAHPAALGLLPSDGGDGAPSTALPVHPLLDGVALACGLAALARCLGGLAVLVRIVSRGARLWAELPVGRERLGQVVRRLAEQADGHSGLPPVDGVRVRDGRGWAVVRPDPDRPLVHLRVEAATLEDARDLLARFMERVRQAAGHQG